MVGKHKNENTGKTKVNVSNKVKKRDFNTPYFDPVDPNPDFAKMEELLLDSWYKQGIVDKYLHKNDASDKYFSFLDGPITANNPMGVHHAWGRTYKDLWQRYKNMRGFKQRFQNGFDCQGLWVEVEVEKELGLKSKKEIENLVPGDRKASIAKFVQLCRDRVKKYSDIQTQQTVRLGNFMDWEHSYFTLSENNNYMIWNFLKKCHEKGLIYKGRDSVPWCPRCQTSISQHEILTEDYKDVTHDSVYFRLPLKERDKEYLLVWTTTPWTIPANVSVAVDPDLEYAKTQSDGDDKFYWVLRDCSERLNLKVVDIKKGSELVGLKYEAPFDFLPRVRKSMDGQLHSVIATDKLILPISGEEGTGLVHIAPGAGSEDFALSKKQNLPAIEVIDEEANYLTEMDEFSGKNAKKHPEIIFDFLKKDEGRFLFQITPYKHRYPACWRCKTELVWRVVDEWYIAIDPVREDMKKVTEKINWIPEFGKARELDWLNNMHDWLISKKNRYWGLALPIWECDKCGNFDVIGSMEELKEKTVEGWDKFEGKTPHKPYIDDVKIKCSKCGDTVSRIEPVGNPWLDAGIVAYSTVSQNNSATLFEKSNELPLYLTNKIEWEKWIPADFITESFPGQFKNWFYSLIAMSTVLENKEPFKTVLGYATQLAEDGRPMHKSWGNSIEFNEGAAKIGVDVMRWMFSRQNPAENLLFGYKIADEVRRQFHLKLWNIYNYFVTYANLDDWKPDPENPSPSTNTLDVWIVSRLHETLDTVENSLEDYESMKASAALEEFVDDLSNWYIRRSRARTGFSSDDARDKQYFYGTTYFVLTTLAKILAPFVPFVADIIFGNLTKTKSVHLSDWPKIEASIDNKLISDMKVVRLLCEIAHSKRKEKSVAVRHPLLAISTNISDLGEELANIVKDEINVKNVNWGNEDLSTEIKVELDLTITEELEEEAKTRDLIRSIQQERKNIGVSLTDEVEVQSQWLPKDKNLNDLIKKTTLTKTLSVGEFSVKKIS